MDEPTNNDTPTRLIDRLGNWLKKDVVPSMTTPAVVAKPSPTPFRQRGLSTNSELDAQERQSRKERLGRIRKSEFSELRKSIGQSPLIKPSGFSLTAAALPNTSLLAQARHNTRLKIDFIEEQISRSWFNSGLQRASVVSGMANVQGKSQDSRTNNQVKMRVEIDGVTVDFSFPPEAVNAATAYALGDFVSAEQILLGLSKRPESTENAQVIWDLLFELYLFLGKQNDFDNLSVDFAAKFGKSPPLWADNWGSNATSLAQAVTSPVNIAEPFVIKSTFTKADFDELVVYFEKSTESGVCAIDWSQLVFIDNDVQAPLLDFWIRIIAWPGELRYLGAPHLAQILQQQTNLQTQEREAQKLAWQLLALHLYITGDEKRLEEVSIEYVILFEESAHITSVMHCRYTANSAPEPISSLDTLAPPSLAQANAIDSNVPGNTSFVVQPNTKTILVLGTLKGDIRSVLTTIPFPTEDDALVFDCTTFSRIDAQAAGHFLGFLRNPACGTGAVKLKNLSRFIGIYLFSFGLPQNVTMSFVTL